MNGGWPQWKKQKTGQLCHQVMNWTLLPMTWCSVYVSGEGADIDIALLCHFTISLGSISLDFKSLNFISLDSISLKSISLNSITLDSIPLNSISFDSLSLYFHSLFYYTTLLTKLTRKLLLLDPLFSTSQHYLVRGVQNNRKFWVHTGFSKHRPSGLMLSICQNVYMCVCLWVCLFVCLCFCSLLRYRLAVFLPPVPEVGCPLF